MRKRNLFEAIFGKKKERQDLTTFKVLNGYESLFTKWGKGVYESKVVRTAIDRIATHTGKLTPKHVRGDQHIKGDIDYLLSNRPNPIMSTYDFLYKIASQLYTNNNAFVFIAKNSEGMITGFYPIISYEEKLLQDKSGKVFLRFKFINGKTYTLLYTDLIHLRKFYNDDDFWGDNNHVLDTDIETAHTSSERH